MSSPDAFLFVYQAVVWWLLGAGVGTMHAYLCFSSLADRGIGLTLVLGCCSVGAAVRQ